MRLKSLVSLQKEAKDHVVWHNLDKNIYDEIIDMKYITRFLGIPIFIWKKDIHTTHYLENEKTIKRLGGFKQGDSK